MIKITNNMVHLILVSSFFLDKLLSKLEIEILRRKNFSICPIFPRKGYTWTNLDEGTKNIAIPCTLELSAICRCSYHWKRSKLRVYDSLHPMLVYAKFFVSNSCTRESWSEKKMNFQWKTRKTNMFINHIHDNDDYCTN